MKDFFNSAQYGKIERDVTNFCDLVNNEIFTLLQNEILFEEPTEEVVKDICIWGYKKAQKQNIEACKRECASETKLITNKTRQQITEVQNEKLQRHINKFMIKAQASRLPLGLFLEPYERLQFIEVKKGRAVANVEAMKTYCTIKLDCELAQKIEERARALHKELSAFDVIIRNMSNNALRLIGHPEDGDCLINVYGGVIDLSLDRLSWLDYSDKKKSKAENMKYNTDLYIITGETK